MSTRTMGARTWPCSLRNRFSRRAASVDLALGMGTGQPYNDADGPWSAGVAFGKTSP